MDETSRSVTRLLGVIVFLLFLGALSTEATDYSSSGFTVRDPVISITGGRATSTDFELYSSVGQTAIGEESSAGFTVRSGFLYYHVITSPTLSASAGDGQVSLTWTAAEEPLGELTASYAIGQSTIVGGPYSFADVGNITASTRTQLTNGTTYRFVVQARDSDGNSLATSTEVGVTPVGAAATGGGGGGGGGTPIGGGTSGVVFSGRAYPSSGITLLKDAQVAAITVAGPDANFQVSLGSLSAGSYIFALYGTDNKGDRSALQTFPLTLSPGVIVYVSGIFIAPTIAVDKIEVKRGENISIFGQSTPSGNVTVAVNSHQEFLKIIQADASGAYLYNFDTYLLELGQHSAKSKATIKNEISPFSKSIGFLVGNRTVLAQLTGPCPEKADLNGDCRVNLVDFSVAAYWYKRALTNEFRNVELGKLSGDGKVDITDFSIMAFYWTG